MAIITKSEFARLRNVTPGRVTQWLTDGKIFGAALVGEGRSAGIDEEIAVEQLRRTLDPRQRTANGAGTNLETGDADAANAVNLANASDQLAPRQPALCIEAVDASETALRIRDASLTATIEKLVVELSTAKNERDAVRVALARRENSSDFRLASLDDAAKAIGRGRETVRRWAKRGEITAFHSASRWWVDLGSAKARANLA